MDLVTLNNEVKLQHCFLRFDLNLGASPQDPTEQQEFFGKVISTFNQGMRTQLSAKGTATPGKIMHTKVFHTATQTQIRCYFAYNNP